MRPTQFLKLGMDELRMQMLGVQVLFGFQFHSIFQDGFERLDDAARYADILAMALMIGTLGILISVPAQHRLVEKGHVTQLICAAVNRMAQLVPLPFALALALNAYVVTHGRFSETQSIVIALGVLAAGLGLLTGLAGLLRLNQKFREASMPHFSDERTPLHDRIDHMLTESRVVLPGAQALLGFQFIAILTNGFDKLPQTSQQLHFAALALVTLSILLLIAPAAIHRITFKGQDRERFHRIGSFIVGIALMPLAMAIAADFYVALEHVIGDMRWAAGGGLAALLALLGFWYALPLLLRSRAA
jgi:hypothetical protein